MLAHHAAHCEASFDDSEKIRAAFIVRHATIRVYGIMRRAAVVRNSYMESLIAAS